MNKSLYILILTLCFVLFSPQRFIIYNMTERMRVYSIKGFIRKQFQQIHRIVQERITAAAVSFVNLFKQFDDLLKRLKILLWP